MFKKCFTPKTPHKKNNKDFLAGPLVEVPTKKKQKRLCQGKKVTVDYGFPWDTNTGLLGRSPCY